MKNTCSPQANSVYHELSPETHGMEKYLAMQHKSWAFYWRVYLDFSTAEKFVFSIGLRTNVEPQSLPILILFYRPNKSSGTHINGGVMCCLHPFELNVTLTALKLNSLFMSFSPKSIYSLLISYGCDLDLCLKWLDQSLEAQQQKYRKCFAVNIFSPHCLFTSTLLCAHLYYFFKHTNWIRRCCLSRDIFLFVIFQMNYSGY